jgi:hypothetical protein
MRHRHQAVTDRLIGHGGDDCLAVPAGDGDDTQELGQRVRAAVEHVPAAAARGCSGLGRRQQRDEPVRARRGVDDPAAGIEDLHDCRPGRHGHRVRQAVGVRQRGHFLRRLPRRVVEAPVECHAERAGEQDGRPRQRHGQPRRGGQREPRAQAPAAPPDDQPRPAMMVTTARYAG